jgi:Mn-dependent DtxR family transcriptional regulator
MITPAQEIYVKAIQELTDSSGGARPLIHDLVRHTGKTQNAVCEMVHRLKKSGVVKEYRIDGRCRGFEVV